MAGYGRGKTSKGGGFVRNLAKLGGSPVARRQFAGAGDVKGGGQQAFSVAHRDPAHAARMVGTTVYNL